MVPTLKSKRDGESVPFRTALIIFLQSISFFHPILACFWVQACLFLCSFSFAGYKTLQGHHQKVASNQLVQYLLSWFFHLGRCGQGWAKPKRHRTVSRKDVTPKDSSPEAVCPGTVNSSEFTSHCRSLAVISWNFFDYTFISSSDPCRWQR